MTVFGKPLSAYAKFSQGVIIAIVVVGLTRLALSLAGVPNSTTKWVSMSGVMLVGLFYLAIRIHTTGFGTYKHLFPALLMPIFFIQGIAILGIVIGMVTGNDNVFTTPEYAFGQDGKTLLHLGAHLVIGIPASTLMNWLIGCLVLFITRKLVRRSA
jgi:hypothetical protein